MSNTVKPALCKQLTEGSEVVACFWNNLADDFVSQPGGEAYILGSTKHWVLIKKTLAFSHYMY